MHARVENFLFVSKGTGLLLTLSRTIIYLKQHLYTIISLMIFNLVQCMLDANAMQIGASLQAPVVEPM